MSKSFNKMKKRLLLGTAMVLLSAQPLWAFDSARNKISGYVDDVVALTKWVGLLVGIIGALRIYNKWSNGDQDINKEVVGWGGAALFLVLAPEFIRAIFNL